MGCESRPDPCDDAAVERLDPSAFFRAPHGHYLATEGLLYWCLDATLWGVTFGERLDAHCISQLIAWIEEEHRHPQPPYATVIDLRRLRSVDADAFVEFESWYGTTRQRQRSRVLRAAIVRPDRGLPATLVAGLPTVLAPAIPCEVCVDLASALLFLEVAASTSQVAALEAMSDDLRLPPLLDQVRAVLEGTPKISAEAVATSVGQSLRTLQRRLKEAGTSLDAETQLVRLRRAQRLLATTDEKLGAVALDAGFATQSHLNAAFRRLVGETPGDYRRRVRGR